MGDQPVFRILVAEDSPDNLALIRVYLKGSRFELDFAENGKIAVDKVISDHPDLVLMDVQMPLMDGLEATRLIRQWEATTHASATPILALTAAVAGEAESRSEEAGCTEHLTKPITKAALLEAISRYLGKDVLPPPKARVTE